MFHRFCYLLGRVCMQGGSIRSVSCVYVWCRRRFAPSVLSCYHHLLLRRRWQAEAVARTALMLSLRCINGGGKLPLERSYFQSILSQMAAKPFLWHHHLAFAEAILSQQLEKPMNLINHQSRRPSMPSLPAAAAGKTRHPTLLHILFFSPVCSVFVKLRKGSRRRRRERFL